MTKLIYPHQCEICGTQFVEHVVNHVNFVTADIWFCRNCNHWFTSPEPSETELTRYYAQAYSSQRKKNVRESYYALMERRADAQLRFIQKHIQGNLYQKKVLDWGCGVGALVAAFGSAGADSIGYDSDPQIIAAGKKQWGANIHVSSSTDFSRTKNQFDFLLLSHVIEHLPSIQQTLSRLFGVLRPGGYIFIEVPNCCEEMFFTLFDPESHLHFFSKKSLLQIIEKMEVQTIACMSCGMSISETLIQSKKNMYADLTAYFISPIIARISKLWSRARGRRNSIKTIYDGFYETYPHNNTGMWLRYIGQMRSSERRD